MKLKKMGALSLALAMTVTAMTGCAMPSTGGSDNDSSTHTGEDGSFV